MLLGVSDLLKQCSEECKNVSWENWECFQCESLLEYLQKREMNRFLNIGRWLALVAIPTWQLIAIWSWCSDGCDGLSAAIVSNLEQLHRLLSGKYSSESWAFVGETRQLQHSSFEADTWILADHEWCLQSHGGTPVYNPKIFCFVDQGPPLVRFIAFGCFATETKSTFISESASHRMSATLLSHRWYCQPTVRFYFLITSTTNSS